MRGSGPNSPASLTAAIGAGASGRLRGRTGWARSASASSAAMSSPRQQGVGQARDLVQRLGRVAARVGGAGDHRIGRRDAHPHHRPGIVAVGRRRQPGAEADGGRRDREARRGQRRRAQGLQVIGDPAAPQRLSELVSHLGRVCPCPGGAK
jgi:hypothetical protein